MIRCRFNLTIVLKYDILVNKEVIAVKTYTIIAGVNGVGKSSLTGVLSRDNDSLGCIIDTDSITRQKNGNKISGAKEAVRRINLCLEKGLNFTQETTLSGYRTLRTIKAARELDYRIQLYYVAVESADESICRIANRVRKGGHDIPTEDVKRRFSHRFDDLLKVLPFCDYALFYDNENGFVCVAEYLNGEIRRIGDFAPQWLGELQSKFAEQNFFDSCECDEDELF